MPDYTIKNLDDLDDVAAAGGLDFGVVRFPRKDVDAESTGFAHVQMHPGARQPFGHRHTEAEEVYFVISGSGAVKLDDEVRDLHAHDIVRVAPPVMRCFEAGTDGMEFLVFGARHEGDGETAPGFWE